MKKKNTEKLFFPKLFYTLIIITVYAFMRKVNLYCVDVEKMSKGSVDTNMVIGQLVGGDLYQCSITAVGYAPYMIASIIVMIIQVFTPSDSRSRISPKRLNKYTLLLTMIVAIIQAIIRSNELMYLCTGNEVYLAQFVCVLEMIVGTILMIWLSARNKHFGIGGQLALFLVNIYESISNAVDGVGRDGLIIPLLLGLLMVIIMLFMENTEKRIPLQRISIHNIYADKNYQAIKFNPVGVMPALFASAAFMLPQFVVKTLVMNKPDDGNVKWLADNLVLTKDFGVIVYVSMIFLLNLLFAWIMINPKEMSESLKKSGDSVENLHPGKETKRYLLKNIIFRTFVSSTIIGVCLGGSLLFQIHGNVQSDAKVAMLPSSLMIFAGLSSSLHREAEAIINTDSYSAFI